MVSALDPTLEGRAPAMGPGYSVQNTQMLLSVVSRREPKNAARLFLQ